MHPIVALVPVLAAPLLMQLTDYSPCLDVSSAWELGKMNSLLLLLSDSAFQKHNILKAMKNKIKDLRNVENTEQNKHKEIQDRIQTETSGNYKQ